MENYVIHPYFIYIFISYVSTPSPSLLLQMVLTCFHFYLPILTLIHLSELLFTFLNIHLTV